ncbi:terminase large subunit (Gp2) [Escherichia coli]|nr:terminase large subunit (Gp2) [Escherichia coli]
MKADPTPADEATSYAIRFPDDPEIFSQTEAQQLVAEELVEKWEKGKMRLLWDNKKRRNEALDCPGVCLRGITCVRATLAA